MRLILIGVGRLKAGPERELFERYLTRIRAVSRSAGISKVDSVEVDEARSRNADERKCQEAATLKERLSGGAAFLVAFDERGTSTTSPAFAAIIGRARDNGTPAIILAVGGPDGLDETFRKNADLSFAFGTATLPHQLVRVLVAEQIYRALTILTNHPYHRP